MTDCNAPGEKTRTRHPLAEPVEWASDTQIARRYCVSRATVWRWTSEGILPKPHKIAKNTTRWRLADVTAALEGSAA